MVFEARRLFECAAMPLVAKRASRRSLAELRKLVRREDAAFRAGDIREWIRLSGEFHVRLVALCANGAVLRFASELVTRSLLMTALYMPSGQTSCAAGDHRALLEALAGGDATKAARLMHDHLAEREARLDLRGNKARPVELAVALGLRNRAA
jgi:DNA-binding GntR family transcriptional regulator